jgi:membrane protease subunit HflK
MTIRIGRLFADNKGPWGSGSRDGDGVKPVPPNDDAPSPAENPWGRPTEVPTGRAPGTPNLEELLRRGRQKFGGGGSGGGNNGGASGGIGFRPDGSIFLWAAAALLALWLLLTSIHSVAPQERGVVTRFGRYAYTLSPGVGITLPSPIDKVRKVDVEKIQTIDLGSEESETLMLTGDGNIIDIAYQVRFNIRVPEQYLFELAQPDETIRQVAESAMRAAIANVTLRDATQSAARSRTASRKKCSASSTAIIRGSRSRASPSARPIPRPKCSTPSRKSRRRSSRRKATSTAPTPMPPS